MSNRLNLPHPVKAHAAQSEQYIVQECSQLRDEIWTRVKDQRTTETYMLLACAVIYWFLSLHKSNANSEEIQILFAAGWYVPPMLAFLAAGRWCENVRLINQIADYTRTREKELLGPHGGWETYLKQLNNGRGPSVLLSGYYVLFLLFLVFYDMEIVCCVAGRLDSDHCDHGRDRLPADYLAASQYSSIVTLTRAAAVP